MEIHLTKNLIYLCIKSPCIAISAIFRKQFCRNEVYAVGLIITADWLFAWPANILLGPYISK
jgi:hypothetical protein